jgi:photosystem II CP47 chlorophyll apoprotein
MSNLVSKVRIPWFRFHIIIINDPGRLLSVHLVHTGLVSGWSSIMLIYELIVFDSSDPLFDPVWRQGTFTLEFATRLGVVRSLFGWCLGLASPTSSSLYWSYESVAGCHILLSGLLLLASLWHYCYWDLDLFFDTRSSNLVLDLAKIFGIHLLLSSITCFCYGYSHISGLFGPGIWSTDTFGLIGSIRKVKPLFSLVSINTYKYGVICSHHLVSGILGILVSIFHLNSRPQTLLFTILKMGNIESVLSTSIISVAVAGSINSFLVWYGGVVVPIELFGPSRYHWDSSFFSQELERRVKSDSTNGASSWCFVNDKLLIYDYIGSNPAKGGLFRTGPIIKGDGLLENWLGHSLFKLGSLPLFVRRIPPFFESFPLLLIDQRGRLRADIAFRRAQSSYSIEETSGLLVAFSGGILDGKSYSRPSLIKGYALKSQFGEIFTFDKNGPESDGVFRTSVRGWYGFSHLTLSLLFFFGHLWHAARALFKDLSSGITLSSGDVVEYGVNEKLGDAETSTLGYL